MHEARDDRSLDQLIHQLRGLRIEVGGLTLWAPSHATDEQREFLRAFLQGEDLAIGALPAETMLPTLMRMRDFRIPLVLAAVLTVDGAPWTQAGARRVALAIDQVPDSSRKGELRQISDRIVRAVALLPRNADPLRRHFLTGSQLVAEICTALQPSRIHLSRGAN